jgi:polyhydroxybutyrate depolymerase
MKKVDDVAFASSIISILETRMNVDPKRVYVTGYSDGGSLSYLIACKTAGKIAAAAAVGSTLYDPLPSCSDAIPVMNIHATGDRNVPYAGKKGLVPANERGTHTERSARDVVNFWTANNRCSTIPATVRAGKVIRESYQCLGADVVFFTIEGGEHGWPGGGRGWVLSPIPPKDLSATDSIFAFFLQHARTN